MTVLVPESNKEQSDKKRLVEKLMDRLAQSIDDTDEQAAAQRVAKLRAEQPEAMPDELVKQLIFQKCRDTAVVGGTTSGAMLVPGIGTISALTVGIAADIGITFKMQAELVLEIAAVYGHELEPEEKRRIVLMVTGLSTGTTAVAHRAGKRISQKLTARVSSKYATRALPVIGIVASAGTNALMTYFIGKRAQAYFSLGPEAMQDWESASAALTGLDRQKIMAGLKDGGQTVGRGVKNTGSALVRRGRLKKKSASIEEEDEIIPVFDKNN
jgi:uncharacterized protein (DUF697 family)